MQAPNLNLADLSHDTTLSMRHIALFLPCRPGIISQEWMIAKPLSSVSLRRFPWAFVGIA